MSAEIAVVDTSVILLMVAPIPEHDDVRFKRQQRTRERLQELANDGVSFVVPAPVVTELGMLPTEPTGRAVAEPVLARFGGMRVEPFDLPHAEVAAAMLRPTFKALTKGAGAQPRDVVKVDAMIVATAVRLNARYLLTANEKDFRKFLEQVDNRVELVIVDEVRQKGQLRFIDRK